MKNNPKVVKLRAKAAPVNRQELAIETEYIKLDSCLKFAGIAMTGGHAKIMIEQGEVSVNGEICSERGRKLRDGDEVRVGREIFVICRK